MERHIDEELQELREKLLIMASLTEKNISLSIQCLKERKEEIAQDVYKNEETINFLDIEIDQICMKLLALHQPMAVDLRYIVSVLKISSELERIADQGVNIIDRSLVLINSLPLKPLIDISCMASLAQSMLKNSIESFIKKDVGLARNVCRRDDEMDDMNDQIFRVLLAYMMQEPTSIKRAVGLMLIGRHLERIADHSTNISEEVIYYVKGKSIKHHYED
jgi:phosphate transport system protein